MDTQNPNNEMAGTQNASGGAPTADTNATPANQPAMSTKNTAPQKSATPKGTASKSAPAKGTAGKSGSMVNGGPNKTDGKVPQPKASAATAQKVQPKPADKNKLVSGSSSPVAFYNPKAKSGQDSNDENDLKKLMVDTMKDIYYAEKRILKAFPKMAKSAQHQMLSDELAAKKTETEAQIGRIEEAFQLLGLKAQPIKCAAMDGILEEASEHIDEYVKGAGRDAAIVVSAQKVDHYGIASYGSLRTFAQNLGLKEVAAIFQEIANQKGAADKKLTQLAKTINTDALKAHKESNS